MVTKQKEKNKTNNNNWLLILQIQPLYSQLGGQESTMSCKEGFVRSCGEPHPALLLHTKVATFTLAFLLSEPFCFRQFFWNSQNLLLRFTFILLFRLITNYKSNKRKRLLISNCYVGGIYKNANQLMTKMEFESSLQQKQIRNKNETRLHTSAVRKTAVEYSINSIIMYNQHTMSV